MNLENRLLATYVKEKLELFEDKYILRTFIMSNIVFVICNVSAMLPAKPFLLNIMDDIKLPLDSKKALGFAGTGTLCGAFLNMSTVKFIGKRKLLITSIVISCFGQITLGLYAMGIINIFLINSWLPVILFCCISFISGYGIAPIPWILLSELFPMKSRGVLSGITAALTTTAAFCFTKTYWDVVNLFGLPWTIVIYGFFGLTGIPYIYYKLPETENKTLQQIQNDLETK